MPAWPFISVPRNHVAIVEEFGVITQTIEGGENGRIAFVRPWSTIRERVNTGLITTQILRGERRLYFSETGSWIDFAEAVAVIQVVDVGRAVYDVSYESTAGTILRGLDASTSLMRANLDDAFQSFVANTPMRQAIYLAGPAVTENILGVVPNLNNVHPAFAGLTSDTGIAIRHIRLSGVTLNPAFAQAMEEIALSRERLSVEQQRRTDIQNFITGLATTMNVSASQATNEFLKIQFGQMLQSMNAQFLFMNPQQLTSLLPLMATLGAQVTPQQQQQPGQQPQQGGQPARGGRRRRRRP